METHQELTPTLSRQIYASSILAMTALFFFAVAIPCAMAWGWPAGTGLGAMCAVWGGPGFGVMAAGARVQLVHDKAAARAIAPARQSIVNPSETGRLSSPMSMVR